MHSHGCPGFRFQSLSGNFGEKLSLESEFKSAKLVILGVKYFLELFHLPSHFPLSFKIKMNSAHKLGYNLRTGPEIMS